MRKMALRRMFSQAAGAALAAAVLAAPGASLGAPVEESLARLKSPVPTERISAAHDLSATGRMAHSAPLAALLKDSDPLVRDAAYEALWSIWMRSGDGEVDGIMRRGVAWMEEGRLDQAIEAFTEIIDRKPNYAEGWNKRATALYMAKRYKESLSDCAKTIALNPYHFGALFGVGLNYVGLRDWEGAISAFRRTLLVMPHSEPTQRYIEAIEKVLAESRKKL